MRTAALLGVHPLGVATALTIQGDGPASPGPPLPPELVAAQLRSLQQAYRPDTAKVGLLTTREIVEVLAAFQEEEGLAMVLDPVISASQGGLLCSGEVLRALVENLLPLLDLVTPNIAEAGHLAGVFPPSRREEVAEVAQRIADLGPRAVLIKGGHLNPGEDLLLEQDQEPLWIQGRALEGVEARGTGCFLSTAVAVLLDRGESLPEAVSKGQELVIQALEQGRSRVGPSTFIEAESLIPHDLREGTTPTRTAPPDRRP